MSVVGGMYLMFVRLSQLCETSANSPTDPMRAVKGGEEGGQSAEGRGRAGWCAWLTVFELREVVLREREEDQKKAQ